MLKKKPKIAIFAGANATILSSPPLVTSNKGRSKYGLPIRVQSDGKPPRFDPLVPQRLARPVTVLIEQFSAHPLERDASKLYGQPDGFVTPGGEYVRERQDEADLPVYEVTLDPGDGLYPLPYVARQADGTSWDGDQINPTAGPTETRQAHFPDAARLVEEIDRFGLDPAGNASGLSAMADFDFYRPAPSAGYRQGLPERMRTDTGSGDLEPEDLGRDFYPYRPRNTRREPSRGMLARITNQVQEALAGDYLGAIWLEGSPFVEEIAYWLNILVDTPGPIVGTASHRAHGLMSNDGDRNIADAVSYICSRAWADSSGRDQVGAVVIQDEVIFSAREVQKADARPGGYVATGGHGGILGSMGKSAVPTISFLPVRRHTHTSAVNVSQLPAEVMGCQLDEAGRVVEVMVPIKDQTGQVLEQAIPRVAFVKHGRYSESGDAGSEPDIDIKASIQHNLTHAPLAGFVAEGSASFSALSRSQEAALRTAGLLGMPVVYVGRGNSDGFVSRGRHELGISGSNLTATKARLLLIACLMRFGSLPPAADPDTPTAAERRAIRDKLALYQDVFDAH